MDYEKIIVDTLSSESFIAVLREKLAEKITQDYYINDMSEGLLIKQEVRKLVNDEAKKTIKELIDNYYELKTVKEMIEDEIKKLTKQEIINVFANK